MKDQDIKEWYANKTNRNVSEFDEYDLHICSVLIQFEKEVLQKNYEGTNNKTK